MSKGCMIALGIGVVGVLFFAIIAGVFISGMNREARLRNAITAKQKDNTSEFDNMWKKIKQVAQVPAAKKNALMEIFNGYAAARGQGMQGGGGLAKWVHEAVPNADMKVYDELMRVIVASRDRWTMRQKELLDLKREHDNVLTVFPSSVVCGILGKQPIEVTIVTSAKTEKAFETGKDEDVDLGL